MDQANQLITKVIALKKPKLIIETNQGLQYTSDLSLFKSVCCFPKNQTEWEVISITAGGYNLTWGCRFEVHCDQVIAEAESVVRLKTKATG